MNNNLFFLCCALAVLILSAVIICVAPIINGVDTSDQIMSGWGNLNCKYQKDEYNYNKDHNGYSSERHKKRAKRKVDECYRKNAMHDLEYTAFIMDVSFGFICSILGLLHYFEVGKSIQKYTGLIGTIAGAIILIITIIYVGYSANIFDNDYVRHPSGGNVHLRLYSNGATYKWKDNKYVHNYDEDKETDDLDIPYIKFKDLGKKQYNYNTKFYEDSVDPNSEMNKCLGTSFIPTLTSSVTYYRDTKKCDYIWSSNSQTSSITNKYLYDRWLSTIILGVFVSACGIGLAIFGVLLFLNGNSSGHTPV